MRTARQTIAASLLFLTAILVAVFVGSYYFLSWRYPSSSFEIERDLDSPRDIRDFRAKEAMEQGYSKKEIAVYLAERNAVRRSDYLMNIAVVESTICVISILCGAGFAILSPSSKKPE